MDLREVFRVPGRFSANPHYYDYLHFLDLDEHDSITLVDGGGQVLRRELVGRLHVLEATQERAVLRLHELFDIDPYGRSQERQAIDELTVGVRLETGPFALPCEVVWRVEEEEAPWLLLAHRLVFDVDPLEAGRPQPPPWPDGALEHPHLREIIESSQRAKEAARRYYLVASGEELPRREIMRMGLPPAAFVA